MSHLSDPSNAGRGASAPLGSAPSCATAGRPCGPSGREYTLEAYRPTFTMGTPAMQDWQAHLDAGRLGAPLHTRSGYDPARLEQLMRLEELVLGEAHSVKKVWE